MKTTIISIASLLALASSVAAHASLKYPCPRYSPFGEGCPAVPSGQSVDSSINAPISSMTLGEKQPFCKYTTPFSKPSATWTAGQSVTVKFHDNIAAHSGGHGQFSISYDNGKTFAVIHEVLRYMFVGSKPSGLTNAASVMSYTFKLPASLPSSDKAVFAWTWANASGNREFYMNCADIAIKGGKSKSYTGKKMTVVNYPGYPAMAEFNGNYDTGIELYKNAPKITISPKGSGTSQRSARSDAPESDDLPANDGLAVGKSDSTNSDDDTTSSSKNQKGGKSKLPESDDSPANDDSAADETSSSNDGDDTTGKNDTAAEENDAAGADGPANDGSSAADSDTTGTTGTEGNTNDDIGENADTNDGTAANASDDTAADNSIPDSNGTAKDDDDEIPQSSAPSIPDAVETGTADSGSCTHGAMECTSGNSGYKVCLYGEWNAEVPCAAGTKCKSSGGSVTCGWA
ncbi:hypothetical protein EC988_005399 [Linderina pennispora]|nr:hypothetical protein EC988_005399 [Linderina pennispora]